MYFCGLDWNNLLRRKAEFIPQLDNDEDTSYFDSKLKLNTFLILEYDYKQLCHAVCNICRIIVVFELISYDFNNKI